MHALEGGGSPFLLVCDHAGNAVPTQLKTLGLETSDLEDHIAIDIGAFSLSHWLAQRLDAPLIGQAYSRLVIDCNRRPDSSMAVPEASDGRVVPANRDLPDAERHGRIAAIFTPYHDAIEQAISLRLAEERTTVICAMHSFTRAMNGQDRPWDIGVIHGPSGQVAERLFAALGRVDSLRVGRNVPYEIDFEGDYTLPVHAETKGLPYVEIEICQDLISHCAGQRRIACLLERALREVQSELAP